MFVIRGPAYRHTPRLLAEELGWKTRRWPNRLVFQPDYQRDFLMTLVAPDVLQNGTPDYLETYNFGRKNKYGQRHYLQDAGIPIPATAATLVEASLLNGERFVVRPLRHARGRDYRVTPDRLQFTPGAEYVSELYPKRREYRVIFVFGRPKIWLRKKPNEGVDATAPWGHQNSVFQTIHDVPASPLSRTDAVARLSVFPPIRGAHLVAADILWAGQQRPQDPYAVLELNFSPGLDIDNNRKLVVNCVQSRGADGPVQ